LITIPHNQAMTSFAPFPPVAAWHHVGAREGFEVTSFDQSTDGWLIKGMTAAYEHPRAWAVHYEIVVSREWLTRSARIVSLSGGGERQVSLTHDGRGHWLVDDQPRPDLGGCLDVDLESSAVTNSFPAHRLSPHAGARQAMPAAYVRASTLEVGRLDQHYTPLPDPHRFAYEAPAFDFVAELSYDATGLVVDYPGIARRAH
jgi:uncharacterized protein